MSQLLTIRDTVKDFFRKYDEITTPVLRFIASFIMFNSINSLFGYSDLFEKGIVVFLLSVICALVPNPIVVLVGGIVVLVNVIGVSLEVTVFFAVLFVVMYCVYMRMFPQCSWILALVPIFYMLNIQYAVPLIVMIFAGISGIIPAAFGVVLYYFAQCTKEINSIINSTTDGENFNVFSYIVENVLKNKLILLTIIVFAVVITVSYVIYRLPIDYAWYIAIIAGGVCNILFFPIVGGIVGADGLEMGKLILGTLLGIIMAAVVQLFKGILDYTHKESVQFEDDDYYYYVKAVPKFNVGAKNKSVKKMTKNPQTERTERAERNENNNSAGNVNTRNIRNNMNQNDANRRRQ